VEKGIFGWIPPVMKTKEQDFVDKVGLDAAVFMRFARMCRNIFAILTVIGCGILIPVYLVSGNEYTYTPPSGNSKRQSSGDTTTGKGTSWFYRLTPRNMYGSQSFWALVICAWLFDIVICYFLWRNYRAVASLRRAYFESPEYQRSLHSRTLLLTDVPKDYRSDDGIVKLTEDVHATHSVPRAAIARNVKDLPDLIEEHEETVRSLEAVLAKYLKNPDKLPEKRPTCKASKKDSTYSKGQKVDAIEYLTSRIKELELQIKEVRLSVDKRNALPYGFASYELIAEAHEVAYVAKNKGPKGSIVRLAPKPNDLVWKNLKMPKKDRRWQNFVNNLWVAVLTLLWVAPNVFVAVFLAQLSNLAKVWPAFKDSFDAHQKWWAIVQGVVAPLITNAFYYYLPAIFRRLSINAGDVTKTSRERNVVHKLYAFFVVNNLIIFSLFAAIWTFIANIIDAGNENKNIWDAITHSGFFSSTIVTLCNISPYWISWMLQRNLGAIVDLSQLSNLAWGSFSRRYLSPTPRRIIELSAPQAFDYAGYYNYFLFYATVTLAFATVQPLMLPVCAFYFWLDSYLKKYLLLYIFITKYESGGMFWRAMYNRFLFAAFLGNVVVALIVVGLGSTGYNWGMLGALGPLPFLLLAFKYYCARTFDDQIHYYQKGKAMNAKEFSAAGERKIRKGDRVGVRFGHPVLYKQLMTPMVNENARPLLKQLYTGRTSLDENRPVGGYSDMYLDTMDSNKPGKTAGDSAPFEFVSEHQMDFEHYRDRPEFRDEAGGDGELYGRPQDLIRPGTPSSMGGMTRTGTMETYDSRSRSQSRHLRGDSDDSQVTRVEGETEYPRGYHQTPVLREQSPAPSSRSVSRGRTAATGLNPQYSQEGLVQNAARMGRSPPPTLPTPYAPTPGGYGPIHTPEGDSEREDTSYDYFRRGRGL